MSDQTNIFAMPHVLERAVLLPLQPRNQHEAEALPARLDALRQQAADDQHVVLNPTHVMVRGGKTIGYLSLNGLPCVHAWFDTHHKHALDSIKMIEHGETVLRMAGTPAFTVACALESPFTPHLPRLGFHKLGTTVLWHKNL